MADQSIYYMNMAIELARTGMQSGKGGPFGCVIVKDHQIIGRGCNSVLETKDPTAHAEVVAIRDACKNLNDFQLSGCEIYTSCEPCPMCLGAIYWARPDKVYYAASKQQASEAGFDDSFIYEELNTGYEERKIPFHQLEMADGGKIFEEWKDMPGKKVY